MFSFFFFFQAEDGIRDKLVTGVQTCALPISLLLQLRAGSVLRRGGRVDPERRDAEARAAGALVVPLERDGDVLVRPHDFRSEERRVGKECRSRWSPYH